MSHKISNLQNIDNKTQKWTTLMQIVDKTKELKSYKSVNQPKYQRLILSDAEGTKVVALIYGTDVHYYRNLLNPHKRYYISNALVRPGSDSKGDPNYPFTWLITNTCLVEEFIEPLPPMIPCHLNFTKFSDLFRFVDTNTAQNVLAVVIGALPPKQKDNSTSSSRDFIIEKPMILNLWNELEDTEGVQLLNNMATGPVVMGLRVKVSTFNGLSLSTWFSSTISINAPIQLLMDIKHWYSNKKEPLIEMVSKECYKNTEMLLPPPKEHDISAIGEGIHLEKKYARAIWVKVTTTALPGQTKYWYTACVTCQKAQSAELHWNFKCTMCNTKTKVENRSRVGLLLNDNTGTMVAYAFGKEAEKLMPLTVAKLKKAAEQGIPIHDKVAEYISTHKLICFVRHYDYTYQAIHERRHAITAIYAEDELLAMQGQVASNTVEDVPESDEKNTLVRTKTLLDDTSPAKKIRKSAEEE